MKKIISLKWAGNLLLIAFGLLAVFHLLVLLGVVPPDIVWGGQIGNSTARLRTLETISLMITIAFAVVVAAKMNYIQAGRLRKVVNLLLWVMFAYSILNLMGNLASGISFENLVFAPVTFIMAVLILRLAIEK